MAPQELIPISLRLIIGFHELCPETTVGDVLYLDPPGKAGPRFELKFHIQLQSYLEVIVANEEHPVLTDVLDQACKTMVFVSQYASAADLKTAGTLHLIPVHWRSDRMRRHSPVFAAELGGLLCRLMLLS